MSSSIDTTAPVLAAAAATEVTGVTGVITIQVPHDLAVQIVGSDAGKARRIRPHSSMTKGAPPAELDAVAKFMQPFLAREIDRVHNRSASKVRGHSSTATPVQAQALKRYCQRFAANLQTHLDKHPDDDRRHRTRQRLDQAYDVVRQVNMRLGQPDEAVVPLDVQWREALSNLNRLHQQLQQLAMRVEHPEGTFAFAIKEVVLQLLPPLHAVLAQNSAVNAPDDQDV